MNRFEKVKEILDILVGAKPVHGHGTFWRGLTRDEFVAFKVFDEVPLIVVGDGPNSNIIKALKGELPFGSDPAAEYRRMPAGRPPANAEQISFIETWINEGCLEDDIPPPPPGPAPQDVDPLQPAIGLQRHVLFWRDFDNWSLFQPAQNIRDAINYFMPRASMWTRYAAGNATEAQWEAAVGTVAMQGHLQTLSGRQQATVSSHYGDPPDTGLVLDSFEHFGDGSLPPDPLRPQDPQHQMNDGYMWFIWSACADACLRSNIDVTFWQLAARALVTGLCNEGLFRNSFTVSGFPATPAGKAQIRTYVTDLAAADLPAELARRFRESGL